MNLALADRRVLRLVVLCALYVAQGIPYGFVAITLAAYLAGQNVGTAELGNVIALSSVPWLFKAGWGPLVDRFNGSQMGRRRPWIVGAQAMMIVTAVALISVPELRSNLTLLAWIVFANNVFVSIQDVSVDGLAVDLLPESERGVANGLMYGSSYLGMIIGGSGLSIVLARHGLRSALIVEAVCLAAIMMLPLLLRERSGDRLFSFRSRPRDAAGPKAGRTRDLFRDLFRAFARRSPLLGVGMAVTIMIGMSALSVVSPVLLMQTLGWTQEQYGNLVGGIPPLFGFGGAIGGGWIADRIGHKRSVAISSIALGISWIGFGLAEPFWPHHGVIVVTSCIEQFFLGTLSAALFALFMGVAWPRVAASQFTAFMALLNLSRTLGAKLASSVSESLGFVGCYIAFGILQIAVVLWLIPLDPQQNRRELPSGDDP
jgi:PAT family beta-lactamase induction signal transducer AmpG